MLENLGTTETKKDAEEMSQRTQEIAEPAVAWATLQEDAEQILSSAITRTILENDVTNMNRGQVVDFLERYGYKIIDIDTFLLNVQKVKYDMSSLEKVVEELKSTLEQN